MTDIIVILILVTVAVLALLRARKHFRGGGCCGSSNTVRRRKKLNGPIRGEKMLSIQGMHCENCRARVEDAVNRLDGVSCRVHLRRKVAVVRYDREISDDVLKQTVEKIGYTVTKIQKRS